MKYTYLLLKYQKDKHFDGTSQDGGGSILYTCVTIYMTPVILFSWTCYDFFCKEKFYTCQSN